MSELVAKKPDNCKKALITGITGQDGSYLTEFLLAKGYEVHGDPQRPESKMDAAVKEWASDAAAARGTHAISPRNVFKPGNILREAARLFAKVRNAREQKFQSERRSVPVVWSTKPRPIRRRTSVGIIWKRKQPSRGNVLILRMLFPSPEYSLYA